MNKIWRSCTALLMALCLMLGVCSTGFTAGAIEEGEVDIDLEQIIDELIDSGKLDTAVDFTMDYAHELAEEVADILKQLDPTVEELGHKLEGLHEELAQKLHELDNELAPHLAEQENILANLVAERAALVEKLAALNEKLVAVKNGSFLRTVPTTDALDAAIAELEADIAATEAEIAELDAAIAWAYEQITADKSGIEAIKAAIVEIKNSIIATEAALAEVNAAIEQLVADLAVLKDALVVLAEAAEALANKTGVDLDVEEVIAAVITVAENIPAVLESIEETYYKIVEITEKVEATVAEIKALVETINTTVENMIAGAEELVGITVEEAKLIQATIEEMAWMIHEFGNENLWDLIGDAMPVIDDLKALAHGEAKKAYDLWLENENTVYAAAWLGYKYCEQKGYIEEAEQLVNDLLEVTDEEIECIKTHLGYVEEIVLEQLDLAEQILTEKLAELEEEYFGAEGGLKAHLQNKIQVIKQQLADVKAVIIEIKNYFAELFAAVNAVEEALAQVAAAAQVAVTDLEALKEAVLNLQDAIVRLDDAVAALNNAVANEVARVLGYAGIVADEAIDVVETLDEYVALLRHIPAILKEAVIHATNDHYLVSQDSHFVALGDANAYGTAADLLSGHLNGFLGAEVSYENATVAGQSAADLLALLPELKDTLLKADLVTIGFGANTFTQFVIEQLTAVLMGGEVAELAWEELLGADGAAYVADAMADIKAELVNAGAGEMMGMNLSDVLALAIESYAYAYAEYAINYVQVVDGVHAINPEAQVVLVGMHNPMAGIVLDLNGTEIALGDYLQYIVDVSNAYAFAYAFIVPQTIYVDAPAVESAANTGKLNALQFVMGLLTTGTEEYVPSEKGNAYIAEQIWNALNAYKNGMLGDVNNDGKVNHIDAMLVLRYYTGKIGANDLALDMADVDGDGKVNHVDAMLILRYYTGKIAVFPAAN